MTTNTGRSSTLQTQRRIRRSRENGWAPFFAAVFSFAAAFTASICSRPISADTLILKTGGKIENCRLVSQDETSVRLRTASVGPMTVPRDKVHSLQRAQSVFDKYDAALARLEEKDVVNMYRLALSCRRYGGLRKESDALLRKILAIDPDHRDVRRFLGYLWVGSKWRRVKPLVIYYDMPAEETQEHGIAEVFSQQLSVFLQARSDVELRLGQRTKKSSGSCVLQTRLQTTRGRASTFYGQRIREATIRSTIGMAAAEDWVGKPLALVLDGEAPVGIPDAQSVSISDAMMRNSHQIHGFLDQLVERRLAATEERLRAKAEARARTAEVKTGAAEAKTRTAESKTGAAEAKTGAAATAEEQLEVRVSRSAAGALASNDSHAFKVSGGKC